MKLHLILAQRRENYPGEYSPEALEVADEVTMEENPKWLYEQLSYHRGLSCFERVEVMAVSIPDEAISALLKSSLPTVEATVLDGP